MHGARLGKREARAQSEPCRGAIDRNQKVEIAAFAEDDERSAGALMPLSCDTIGREPFQP
jgi:hypothetical protein